MIIVIIIIAKKQGQAVSGFKADAAKMVSSKPRLTLNSGKVEVDKFVEGQVCLALAVMSIRRSVMQVTHKYQLGFPLVYLFLINVDS